MLKTPYLSIKNQKFLLFVIAILIFGLNHTVYAEGLSGLKESLNKGKIKQILKNNPDQQPGDIKNSSSELSSTIKLQPKPNILKPSKTSLLDSSEAIEKYIIQVKNSKTFKKDFKLNGGSLKKALLKISKNNKNKLKRIGEKVQPVILEDDHQQKQTSRIWISPLPASFPPETKDTVELEAIQDVINFYGFINDPEFYNDSLINLITKMVQIEYILLDAYEEYSEYPYLCALLKFYCTEMRVSILGTYDANYTAEKKFDQIYETYSANMHDNECCREILDMALIRKNKIVSIINNELNQRINEAETHISDVNSYIEEMKDTIYPSEYYAPTKEHIEAVYSEIISSYETIISSHLKKGEYKEAHLKLLEMEKYYSETPTKFKVKYWKEVFNPVTQKYEKVEQSKTYDIKKLTRHYFAAIKSYVSNGGDYSEIDEESSETVLKDINSYIDKVKAYVPSADEECSPEILKHYQEQIDNKFSSSETNDHYYSQNRNITKMYFTKKENKELDSQDIPDPRDNLTLRCVTDSKGPLYKFNQDVVSTISLSTNGTNKRIKTLKLKKDWFYGGNYYAVFRPNETDVPKDDVKNLINNEEDAFKESIAVFTCDNKPDESILPIYNNTYFKHQAGHSNTTETKFDVNTKDFSKIIFKNSVSFLKAGGAEYILAMKNNLKAYALIRNQADWFLIDAHGRVDKYPDGGVSDDGTNPVYITPDQLYNNGKSEYTEDIKILILLACGVLKWQDSDDMTFARGWHKVMSGEKQAILGYHCKISSDFARAALANFNTYIEKATYELQAEEVIARWEIVHEDMFKKYLKFKDGDPEYQEGGEKYVKGIENYIDGAYYSDINSKFWTGGGIERIPVTRKERNKPTEFLFKIKPSFKLF